MKELGIFYFIQWKLFWMPCRALSLLRFQAGPGMLASLTAGFCTLLPPAPLAP